MPGYVALHLVAVCYSALTFIVVCSLALLTVSIIAPGLHAVIMHAHFFYFVLCAFALGAFTF